MDDQKEYEYENGHDAFTQDGVLLKSANANYMSVFNTTGTLCTVEYPGNVKCIEWRPNDILVDSDMQDQEWAMVNTIGRRTRTMSGRSLENPNNFRIVRLNIADMKGFKLSRNSQEMTLVYKDNSKHSIFFFQHANAENFVNALKCNVKTIRSKSDKNFYLVLKNDPEVEVLGQSFAELDIFREHTGDAVWKFMRNLQTRPYETTLEAFSKLTDIVFFGNDPQNSTRLMEGDVADLLSKSMSNIAEATTTHNSSDGYEVIDRIEKLPPRPEIHRGLPMNLDLWTGLKDTEGRILEVDGVKQIIFRGGVSPSIRREVWKYLLGFQKWEHTESERQTLFKEKNTEYYKMKLQWRTMSQIQESNFSDFRDRKSLIEKDVNRTDRTCAYYAGDSNPNLQVLSDILMTYIMYNFDLGYVQGMSDLLSPILFLMENEVDAFWCFVEFMKKVSSNFDIDQTGMKIQLQQLHTLLAFVEPELCSYLDNHDSGNMFFCFRWLLVLFKREFNLLDIMRLWEVLWTGLPCDNFHLLLCVAILDSQKSYLIDNKYGFTEILKHVNDLSLHIDLQSMLIKAEGIYHQIMAASHLTDSIRIILGHTPLCNPMSDTNSGNCVLEEPLIPYTSSSDNVRISSDIEEVSYENSISSSFY